jgi:hypothetical protein
MTVVKLPAPPLGAVMAFKGVWALSVLDTDKDTGHIGIRRATHYACCLIAGSNPVWGVWTVRGVFQRFFSYRTDIAAAYPDLVWVRKVATWSLTDIREMSTELKRATLAEKYHQPLPKKEDVA